jgi:two-component system sensor histidine kinase PhoQ
LGATLLILPLFLGLTALMLDRAFVEYQERSQRESMRLQQLLLAKAADWNGARWLVEGLDEPRLALPGSGLYAFILAPAGKILWQSPSAQMLGAALPQADISEISRALDFNSFAIGQQRFEVCLLALPYFCQATRVAWGSAGPEGIFLLLESQEQVLAARTAYRERLLWMLLGVTLLLMLAQSLIFRWGLAPMRVIAASIRSLERGEADRLEGGYPEELVPLTDNINTLLASEKARRERVRNTMDRLTHVLKTPLMLLRNSTDGDREFRAMAQEQVTRMLGIVEGELAKARLDGRASDILGKPVAVAPVLQRIVDAYARLPRPATVDSTPLEIDTSAVSGEAVFRGDVRDLQDMFGSLLENSLKYCRHRVVVTARLRPGADTSLEITVGDDGDGVPPGWEQGILQRGARADTAGSGHGLGLSIVIEIVSAYGGGLDIQHSELGGALFVVTLPGAVV